MLSIQRGETKQKPMKISYNSEENGRPEKRILNNKKKEKTGFQLEQSLGGRGGGSYC